MSERGKYVMLEGGEGVGKSTQVGRLMGRFAVIGVEAEYVREPGSSPIGGQLRAMVLDPANDLDVKTEFLLFNAARVETLREVEAHLAARSHVLSDRGSLSSIVYQGHARGLPIDEVRMVCDFVVSRNMPDLLVVLDAPLEAMLPRRNMRGINDKFELLNRDFHLKVREGYLVEAERLSATVIDADQAEEVVEEAIWECIEPLISNEETGDERNRPS